MTKEYTEIVSAAKVAARDILRMRKISKWMTRKGAAEADAKMEQEHYEKYAEEREKNVRAQEVEAQHLPEEHPRKAERLEAAAAAREVHTKREEQLKKELDEQLEAYAVRAKECQEAIDEWCEGKRKVSKDELKALTDELIKANVKKEFVEA